MSNSRRAATLAFVATGVLTVAQGIGFAQEANSPGAVYAMTNDAANNAIVVLNRSADGTLTPRGSFPTGGQGSGTFENSANSLIVGEQSPNNLGGSLHYLFATNAGSDSVSVLRINPADGTLTIVDVEPSGGDHPISVTARRNLLYVLNGGASNCTGGAPNISGFRIGPKGDLTPIPGSMRPVSGGAMSGCAQVSFNPAGGARGDAAAVRQDRHVFGGSGHGPHHRPHR
jgi:hypothetical protein